MTPLRKLERGGQSGGSAADYADLLSGRRGHLRRLCVAGLADFVRGEILELRYGYRLLDESAAARLLARMGTDPAERRGDRIRFVKRLYGVRETALCDFLDVLLAVGSCGTVELARPEAVAVVVAHQQFHRELPRLESALALGVDNHALGNLRRAGAEKLGALLDFHYAHSACAIGFQLLHEAQVGNLNPRLLRRRQYRRAFFGRNRNAVNRQVDHLPIS